MNWITLTLLKAIVHDKLVARDGWNLYVQVRMSIEESFQTIYLSPHCALDLYYTFHQFRVQDVLRQR